MKTKYPVVRNLPVAKFYYKGTHSRPVRRTVVVTESNSKYLKGYEIREGSAVRLLKGAPIKTFRKDRIALIKQCGTRMKNRIDESQHDNSTLNRMKIFDLLYEGV